MVWIVVSRRSQCKKCQGVLTHGQKAKVESGKRGIKCASCAAADPKPFKTNKRQSVQQAFDMFKPL